MKRTGRKIKNKIITYTMALTMGVGLCYVPQTSTAVEAAVDTAFENSISSFPDSYKPYLRNLHTKYPQWKFQLYNTNLDFFTAVANESIKDRSLIENSYSNFFKSRATGDYNPTTGKYIAKDGASWVTASKNAVAYFMDPRNFLNEEHIYMFEQLSYDAATQTKSGVEAILNGSFMYNTQIGYINTSGAYSNTGEYYSDKIIQAASVSKVSAYYIASKMLQEIGFAKNATYAGMGASGSINGNYSSAYRGIYNFYNIGASSGANPIANGLSWAKSGTSYERPWDTPGKSIIGGAEYIGAKYINCGQDTTYFQRFNVKSGGSYSLYTHQYMTNVYGCAAEAALTSGAYSGMGIAATEKTFVIPVYNNMPGDATKVKLGSTGNKTGVINNDVNVRKGASTSYQNVLTLKKNDRVTIVDSVMLDSNYSAKLLSNPYWYKIIGTKDGKSFTGYVSAAYVNVDKESTIIKGKTTKLTTTLSAGTEKVFYESDNPDVATVDDQGNVTGLKAGTVTIRAYTVSGSMSPCTVEIYDKGCVLNKKSLTLNINKTETLKATVYPENSANKQITWKSSNTKVATVSSTGVVKGVGVGKAVITATAAIGGVVGKCNVTVVRPVTGVKLNATKKTIAVGGKYTLKATVSPANATKKTVTWKTSNKSVATVKKGVVTAVAAGTANITVTTKNGKKTAVCTIKVVPKQMTFKSVKSSGATAIKLKWVSQPNVTGYYIYRKNSRGKYALIANLPASKTSYKDKRLTSGKKYSYKIKAYRTVGKKKYKGKNSTAKSTRPVPKKVKVTSVTKSGKKALLTWNKVIDATGYVVYKKKLGQPVYKAVKTIKSPSITSYKNGGITAGIIYCYKVKAFKNVAGKKVFGNYSKVVTFKK